jgi:hypothetical protein
VQAGTYGAEGTTYDPSDFFIGHVLNVSEHHYLPVFRGQFVQGSVNALCVFCREVRFLYPPVYQINLFQRLARRSAFSEFAQSPVPRDPVEPGAESADVGQARYSPENIQPHVLESVFSALHIAKHLAQVVTQARLVTFHEFCKGGGVPGLAPEYQYALMEPIHPVGHSGPHSPPSVRAPSLRLRRELEKFKPSVIIPGFVNLH